MRAAIVARVRDRNPMEVANDLGHRFWRLLLYGRQYTLNGLNSLCYARNAKSPNFHKRFNQERSI
jgi:hypothetical protein